MFEVARGNLSVVLTWGWKTDVCLATKVLEDMLRVSSNLYRNHAVYREAPLYCSFFIYGRVTVRKLLPF